MPTGGLQSWAIPRGLLALTVDEIDRFSTRPMARTMEHLKEIGSQTLESMHRTRDGRMFPVEITANYLEFEGRGYLCAFARDISSARSLKRHCARPSEVPQHFRERCGGPVSEHPEGVLLSCNPAMSGSLASIAEEFQAAVAAQTSTSNRDGATSLSS